MNAAAPDVVDVLIGHHQQIKLLFGQLDKSAGEHKERLFADLVALLAVHESVEQMLVHPLARQQLPEGGEVVEARLAEEQEAKAALAELHDLGVADPGFDAKLFALRDAVTAHATAEEEQEFSRLREVSDPGQLQRMVTAVKAAAALAPHKPHPQVPPSAAANLLLGPPLAVFDRVREALEKAVGDAGDEGKAQS